MHIIKGMEQVNKLNNLISKLQQEQIIGFDVEGSALDPHTSILLLIQVALSNGETYVINNGTVNSRFIKYMLNIINERNIVTIGHNIKYDIKSIYHNYGVLFRNPFDTMYTETLTKPGVAEKYSSLDDLFKKYLGISKDTNITEQFVGKTDFDFTDEQYTYAGNDVKYLHQLANILMERIKKVNMQKVWKMEMKLLPGVAKMEYQGVLFDDNAWRELAYTAEEEIKKHESELYNYLADNFDTIAPDVDNALEAIQKINIKQDTEGGNLSAKFRQEIYENITSRQEIVSNVVPMINLGSPNQVVNTLNLLGIETDSSAVQELRKHRPHPFVEGLLEYKDYAKKVSSFGEEFLKHVNPITGAIHANAEQLGTVTGRFAYSDPNLQQIPGEKPYRRCFISRPNFFFMTADYSQIELRLMAEVSGEPKMIEAFQNNVDLHALTASLIFDIPLDDVTHDERSVGKTLNFAVIYGTTEYGLQYNFGWPLSKGRQYLKKYFEQYNTLKRFIDLAGNTVLNNLYSTTRYGRKRYFTLDNTLWGWKRDKKVARIKRQGVNQIIQGDAAEIIKLSMLNFFWNNPFDWDELRPLLQVHDELVLEISHDHVYYDDENDEYKLHKEMQEYVDWAFTDPAKDFLKEVPMKYGAKIEKYWTK